MRRLIALLGVLCCCAAAAWLTSRLGTSLDAPSGSGTVVGTPQRPTQPAPTKAEPASARSEATEVARPTTARPAPAAAGPAEQAPQASIPTEAGMRPTHVEARSLVDNQLLAGFRWRFTAGAQPLRGEALFGVAELPLPAGATGDLLIEAAGMEPLVQRGVTPTAAPAPALRLQVYLRPTQAAEGVTLLVRDGLGRAVDHLRVDAFQIQDAQSTSPWQLGRPLWSRRTSAADGRYQLPPLPPGSYGVQVRATDPDGALRPLSSFSRTFTLTGSNGYLEDVTLQPACALRLELVDAAGEPFDPAGRGDVTITLRRGAELGLRRKWTGRGREGGAVSAIDRVPTTAPIWLAEPVAPGGYQLELRAGGSVLVQQPLQLTATAQVVQVTVF